MVLSRDFLELVIVDLFQKMIQNLIFSLTDFYYSCRFLTLQKSFFFLNE